MAYKPEGYTSVAPYLLVQDAQRTMRFLENAFSAERLRVIARKDGQGIMHCETQIDDTVIMMGEVSEGSPSHVHIYVADPDICFEKALCAGATVVQPLLDTGDGDLRGGVKDPDGTIWWIAKMLS
ncbi:MAG: VOC family protein [Sulfitobacter sp.]